MAEEMVLLRSTYGSEAQAQTAARDLLAQRAACCVHVQRIWSAYPWEGKVEEGEEWLLEARTPAAKQTACWDALLEGHPYDTPLVEAAARTTVPEAYAKWARACTGA